MTSASTGVVVLGGTGLLGQVIHAELTGAGTRVTVVARHDPPPAMRAERSVRADVDSLSDGDLLRLFDGATGVVHALGPDDRSALPRPAAAHLADTLVARTERVIRVAREAGVRRAVVLGSYFTAWARLHPGFAERHSYVAARLAQAERAIAAGGGDLAVAVLEIPWVFGVAPSVDVMWREWLFDRVRGPVAFFPRGGTTATTARTVARAAGAALAVAPHGARYPVGDEDLTWREILTEARAAMGRRGPIVHIPRLLAEPVAWRMGRQIERGGGESGVDPAWLMRDLMYRKLYVDHARTRAELGIERDDVRAEIRLTAREAYR